MVMLHCKGMTSKALDDILLKMIIEVASELEMKTLGESIGARLKGGEVFQLVGDVGAGKTTFVKGLAKGLAVDDEVQSPSFTISRVYNGRDDLELVHYDFYRLTDAGIMANELSEMVHDAKVITVVEWADIVEGVLPEGHYTITITAPTETSRKIELSDELGVHI
jgi:tRNA threonylcarbamoyladenosine biosynthesis protein TsaE